MERIGSEVERTLRRSGGDRALALSEITSAWPAAVGEAVARQAWPLRIGRDGALVVATTSSTWAFELDRLSPDIAARLGALLGASAPAALRFQIGPVPEPGVPSEEARSGEAPSVRSSPETDSEAARVSAEIEDPELRELVARAARASLARARSGRRFW